MTPEHNSIELENLLRPSSSASTSSSDNHNVFPLPEISSAVSLLRSTTCESYSSPAELYASLPLPTGLSSIRVFDLEAVLPYPHSENEIQGTLRVVSLLEDPSFIALSYVWGAYAPQRQTVLCCSCSFELLGAEML